MMQWRTAVSSSSFTAASLQQQQREEDANDQGETAAVLSSSDQRTLYLVNIFIANTTRFLNSFCSLCEDKLSQLHRRILRLDTSLSLLEAKLASTCQYQEFDSSGLKAKVPPNVPVLRNSVSNDRFLDHPFESGESSS